MPPLTKQSLRSQPEEKDWDLAMFGDPEAVVPVSDEVEDFHLQTEHSIGHFCAIPHNVNHMIPSTSPYVDCEL